MKMKKLLTFAFSALFLLGVSAQKTHFDNKPYVEGEMLIQVLDDASIRDIAQRAPVEYGVKITKELSRPMRIWMIEFDDKAISHEGMQYWFYSQPEVTVADYNYRIEMRATLPGDPLVTQQWHHKNTGANGGTVDADIDSDEAWDITTGGTTATNHDIVVCLIESGNLDHNDLNPNRWFNAAEVPNDGIDNDGNGYVDDYDGWNPVQGNDNYGTGNHGTNCLGMIGAKGDNGLLVVGANWDVKLMVVGDYSISTQANAIEAYTYPLVMRQRWNNSGGTQGAFVVATSSSWGIDGANPNNYPLWCAFYDTLGAYGILNVGATTNSNLNVDTAGDMPTACASDYMIGVGRTDNNDNTAGGYGVNTIEFGAPGINVVTTANTNSTTTTTGTSFSCPLTAGVIGLAYSIPCTDFMTIVMNDPQAGADLVLQALLDGTDPKAQLASRFVTGGRLNSFNTLNELMAVACSGSVCLAPSGISAGSITTSSANISFNAFSGAASTTLYWREVGAATWTTVPNATSPASISGLSGCTDYEFYLESDCGGGSMSAPSNTGTFSTSGCGNCVDLPYCSSNATDGTDEWIESFVLSTYTNNSGNDGGFGDYTGSSNISVTLGQTYNFTVTPDWSGTQYNEYTRIWIDYNQNGTLDANEMVYDQGTANQNPATGSITIPVTAVPGSTRLRVLMAYQGAGQNTLPNQCGAFQYGEVEDYCITIVDPSASLNEISADWVRVYPNPASNQVTIEVSNDRIASVEIVDVVGKVIATAALNGNKATMDVSNFTNGTYFYQLKDLQGTTLTTEKMVIAH